MAFTFLLVLELKIGNSVLWCIDCQSCLITKQFYYHNYNYLCHWRETEVMLSPLSACLSVSSISQKFGTDLDETWWTGWVCKGGRTDYILVKIQTEIREFFLILQVILRHWMRGPKTIHNRISQSYWWIRTRLGGQIERSDAHVLIPFQVIFQDSRQHSHADRL